MEYQIWGLLLFLNCLFYVNCDDGYYSITAPGTIRPNSPYSIVVSVHATDIPTTIKLGLEGPNAFKESQEICLKPQSTELIKFEVPDIPFGTYTLTAEGITGIQFKNKTDLHYTNEFKTILIQTDKAIYKPGDLVRFRLLFLDTMLLPRQDDNSTKINIEDPQGNIVMPYRLTNMNVGVYENKLQLSSLAPLGYWKITVNGNKVYEMKQFQVDEYVLPKFDVTIDLPEIVVYPKLKFPVIVKARYTYGKYVTGEAKVSILHVYRNEVIETKTVPLKGKAVVDFDYTYRANWVHRYSFSEIKITAEVTESLSGLKNQATAKIPIHYEKFVIKALNTPKFLSLERAFSIELQVTDHKGVPIQDSCDPLELLIIVQDFTSSAVVFLGEQYLDKRGTAAFKIKDFINLDKVNITKDSFAIAKASYKYANDLSLNINLKKRPQSRGEIYLNILNENPSLHEDIEIMVESMDKMKYFIYQVMAAGNIVLSGKVMVADLTQQIFSFTPTSGMAPKATLFVYYVSNGELHFAEDEINFVDQFKNFIKVKLPSESRPGENINITVTTDAGSYVGLLGVDQSVLLQKTGNDLESSKIMDVQSKYKSHTLFPRDFVIENGHPKSYDYPGYDRSPPWYYNNNPEDRHYIVLHKVRDYTKPYPGEKSGLITLTNAGFPYWKIEDRYQYHHGYDYMRNDMFEIHRPMGMRGMAQMPAYAAMGAPPEASYVNKENFVPGMPMFAGMPPPVTIRKEFPETWLWESFTDVSSDTVAIVSTVPDTITSWVVSAFSVSPEYGLALASPKKLQVFQPFFLTMNLPYSVMNGEVISIPVVVFNYLSEDLETEITMFNEDRQFVFAEATNEIDENPINSITRTKQITVPADSTEIVYFMIRPQKVGKLILHAKAVTPLAGDAIEKVLLVTPEGVTKYINEAVLLEDREKVFSIDIPENVVPDSIHIEVSVAADFLGPTINSNLRGLVRLPSGCGEQNMVNFVPNYLVLEYLERRHQLKSDIESTALKHLQIGYQGELRYKHSDGSFSAFGTSDRNGCTWLTAYVARSFRHASKYIDLDENVIKNALNFLADNQAQNGSFPEVGVIIDRKYASAGNGDLTLTAFTLLSFLENSKQHSHYEHVIKKALDYLVTNHENSDDMLAMAIVTYVLQIVKHDKKDAELDKLLKNAINEGGKMWWSGKQSTYGSFHTSSDIEITSYALLALLENPTFKNPIPIVKWLISKQDNTGGFGSTQSTVVGLQALIKYSEKFPIASEGFKVLFQDDQGAEVRVSIDTENPGYFRSYELSTDARTITATPFGKGAALAQISYQFNVKDTKASSRFSSSSKFLHGSTSEVFTLSICSRFVPQQGESKETNMALMEVRLPTGYLVNKENLNSLNLISAIKKIETKNDDTVAVFYFDNLTADELCSQLEAHRIHKVAKQKPGLIFIYDYYNQDRQTTVFYNPPNTSLCEICEGDDCGPECQIILPR